MCVRVQACKRAFSVRTSRSTGWLPSAASCSTRLRWFSSSVMESLNWAALLNSWAAMQSSSAWRASRMRTFTSASWRRGGDVTTGSVGPLRVRF